MKQQNKERMERRVADSVLEREEWIEIGGERYAIAPPTVATLMMVSELVAEMPSVDRNAKNVVTEVLATAKDMEVLGRIAATLILGSRGSAARSPGRQAVSHRSSGSTPNKSGGSTTKRRWWLLSRLRGKTPKRDAVAELGARILEEMSAQELLKLMTRHLMLLGISDFFALTTSLSEANLLRKTREVATRSGAK